MRNLSGNATRYLRGALLALCCLSNAVLAALPSGGQVVEGTGRFSQTDTRLDITQESQYMVMEWADFSFGANETVSIVQPSADSAVLIRVLSENPALIAGKLQANGQVVIVSPAGIVFDATAAADVWELYASTLALSNQNFLAGQLQFSGSGTGTVVNHGRLATPLGGTVYLLANDVVNDGIIVSSGYVGLVAGAAADLTVRDHPVVAWSDSPSIRVVNAGQLIGGAIYLSSASSINISGAINAGAGGAVTIGDGGDVTAAGSFTNGAVLTTSGAGTLTATTLPAGGNIMFVGGTITPASTTQTVTPVGGTVTLATAEAIYLGTISQQMVSATNFYAVSTAGAVFGTSAIVATTGLATPEGAPVDLAGLSVSPNMQVSAGWNLLGNSTDAPLDVAAAFGDTSHIDTVWKWLPTTSRWAFYTPSLSAQELADYAASKGYDVLASIAGGEGFWVNAQAPFVFALPFGSLLPAATVQTSLTPGWNLVSVGEDKTPGQFGAALGQAQAADATVWAWDKTQAKWYFHAPSLEAQGGTALADYIAGKGYLDFGAAAKSLGAGMGFWVRKP